MSAGNSAIYQKNINFNSQEHLTIQKLLDHTIKIRNRSEQYGKRIDDWVTAKYKKKYKSAVFEKDEKVLVRLRSEGGKVVPKTLFFVKGRAENYKVSLVQPGETAQTKLWIRIEDITALKKDAKQVAKEERKYARRHFLKRVIVSTCSKIKDTHYF